LAKERFTYPVILCLAGMAEFREKIKGNFLFAAVLKSAWLERIRAWISSAP
jgi:hypothetical protein